jgi:hypothetical protein
MGFEAGSRLPTLSVRSCQPQLHKVNHLHWSMPLSQSVLGWPINTTSVARCPSTLNPTTSRTTTPASWMTTSWTPPSSLSSPTASTRSPRRHISSDYRILRLERELELARKPNSGPTGLLPTLIMIPMRHIDSQTSTVLRPGSHKIGISYTISEDLSGDCENRILCRISERERDSGEVRLGIGSSYINRLGQRYRQEPSQKSATLANDDEFTIKAAPKKEGQDNISVLAQARNRSSLTAGMPDSLRDASKHDKPGSWRDGSVIDSW